MSRKFPQLDAQSIAPTRDALHSYAKVIGGWPAALRMRRKHWWQLSLRPSVRGLSTGIVHAPVDFEVELDYASSHIRVTTPDQVFELALSGQAESSVADFLSESLGAVGVESIAPEEAIAGTQAFAGYDPECASKLREALLSVTAALEQFRAGIREETSPIQVWPHHFDLAMIWLPGHKVPGQDPANEEYADKQMNFGFVLGDDLISEPYFYVTAYPFPEAMARIPLPANARWQSQGFNGATLRYSELLATSDPTDHLIDLWSILLDVGQAYLATNDKQVKPLRT